MRRSLDLYGTRVGKPEAFRKGCGKAAAWQVVAVARGASEAAAAELRDEAL